MNKFALRLRELRAERELTQANLAKLLSVNQRTVSNWECGLNEPDFNMLIQIAIKLDASSDYLLGIKDF